MLDGESGYRDYITVCLFIACNGDYRLCIGIIARECEIDKLELCVFIAGNGVFKNIVFIHSGDHLPSKQMKFIA